MATQLTVQQRHLLERIPREYQLPDREIEPEPIQVRRARKIVEKFEARRDKRHKHDREKNASIIRAAREAVYFQAPERALVLVKKAEALMRK